MYRLCLLVLLGVWHASAQLTTPAPGTAVDCEVVGIQNCGKCNMPGLTCAYCPIYMVLSSDYKSCIACDSNCIECELASDGKTGTCIKCLPGYVVRADGTCGPCEAYCAVCAYTDATQTTTTCSACLPSVPAYLLGPTSKQCQDCTTLSNGCTSCTEASDKSLTCTSCGVGFVYDSTNKVCVACPNNCNSCTLNKLTSTTTCTTCRSGYILNTGTNQASSTMYACLTCDPLRCSKCTGRAASSPNTLSTCTTCVAGYYADAGGVCQLCKYGCSKCTSATQCQACLSTGFYYDSANSKCTACSIGCSSCTYSSSVETCTACYANYGFQNKLESCQVCPEDCTACSDPQTCTDCVLGYALVDIAGGIYCLECPEYCADCGDDGNGNAVCNTCIDRYVAGWDRAGNSMCYPCSTNCASCTFDLNTYTTTCDQCMHDSKGQDYYLSTSGVCLSCGSMCTDCTGTDNQCDGCPATGYFLDTSGSKPRCTKCPANCDECDFSNNCTTCTPGYYLNADLTCSPCDANCICTDGTVDGCTDCLKNPSTAPFNYFDGTDCEYCDNYCASGHCVADGKCDLCIAGWVANGSPSGSCIACDKNCDTATSASYCTYTTSVQCSTCKAGYWSDAGTCKACSTGCSSCPLGECNACFPRWTSNGATPVVCLLNDINCAAGSSVYDSDLKKVKCNVCNSTLGYTANGAGVCTPNPDGCAVGMIDPDDTTETNIVCDVCADGYGKVTATSLCLPCPAHCRTCTQNSVTNIMECDECDSDSAMNLYACGRCPRGCTSCKNVNGQMFCNQCSPQGFYLDSKNGICIDCSLCTSCTANGCNPGSCVPGYGLSTDGTCIACADLTTVSGCSNCTDADSTGTSECLDCQAGQVLDGWGSFCVDDSVLTDCVRSEFRAYECSANSCNSPFSWVTMGPGRGHCGLNCAICGNMDAGIYLPADECQNANNNYTQHQVVGACWVSRKVDSAGNVLYARGGTMQYNCTSDNEWEFVSSTDSQTTFKCCQDADLCNESIQLDGVAGASAISFSLALLFASILAALRLF